MQDDGQSKALDKEDPAVDKDLGEAGESDEDRDNADMAEPIGEQFAALQHRRHNYSHCHDVV